MNRKNEKKRDKESIVNKTQREKHRESECVCVRERERERERKQGEGKSLKSIICLIAKS